MLSLLPRQQNQLPRGDKTKVSNLFFMAAVEPGKNTFIQRHFCRTAVIRINRALLHSRCSWRRWQGPTERRCAVNNEHLSGAPPVTDVSRLRWPLRLQTPAPADAEVMLMTSGPDYHVDLLLLDASVILFWPFRNLDNSTNVWVRLPKETSDVPSIREAKSRQSAPRTGNQRGYKTMIQALTSLSVLSEVSV